MELGRGLEPDMPTVGLRHFGIHTARSSGPSGTNQVRAHEELVVTELGQIGTQFDGLPHVAIGDTLYNCVKTEEVATRTGFTKLGVEKVGGIVTRGVLLDVAAAKGVEILQPGYEITVADLESAMKRQGLTIGAGDAVLIHTGWGRLWMKTTPGTTADNRASASQRRSGSPGSSRSCGRRQLGIEVIPNPDNNLVVPVHQIMIATHGIFLLENLELDALARKQVAEFALMVSPLKIKGGTGSTVAPIAMK